MNQLVITFASPFMLLGLLALIAPLIAHRLTRQTGRRVVFPTTALLVAAQGGSRKLHKLRRRTLLLVRMLIVALIVLAFAQPQFMGSRTVMPGASRQLVLVVDSSASMQQVRRGRSIADEARAAALRASSGMRPDVDRVVIVNASSHADVQYAGDADPDAIKAHLVNWEPTDAAAEPRAAAARVKQLAGEHDGQSEVVVVTDGQAVGAWQQAFDMPGDGGDDDDAAAAFPISIMQLARDGASNLAIAQVRMSPPLPRVGQPVQLEVRVDHHAAEADDSVSATLFVEVDGEAAFEKAFDVAADQSRTLQLTWQFDQPGDHVVRFAIQPDARADALAADNVRELVVRTSWPTRVLLVADAQSEAVNRMQLALASDSSAQTLLQRANISDAAERLRSAQPPDVVLLPTLAGVTPAFAAAVRQHVEAGGGLFVWLGAGSESVMALEDMEQLLPLSITPGPPAESTGLTFDAQSSAAGPFARWNAAAAESLKQVAISRRFAVTTAHDRARVWLHGDADNQPPIAASHVVGRGRVLCINASPDPGWSTLGDHAMFPSLVVSSTQWLHRQREATPSIDAGQAIFIPVANAGAVGDEAGGAEAHVVDASGSDVPWQWMHTVEGSSAVVANAAEAGVYRLMVSNQVAGIASAHVPADESRLDAIAPPTVGAAASGEATVVTEAAAIGEIVKRDEPFSLWPLCLVAAMLLLGLESAIISKLGWPMLSRFEHLLSSSRTYDDARDATLSPERNRSIRDYDDVEAEVPA